MSKQLGIYEKVVPVSSQRHKDWSVKTGSGYTYAQETNSVPLIAVEFPVAALEYAIVFAGEDKVMPLAVLGVRNQENLYLKDDGGWEAKYVPAFLRQYPFVFSSMEDGKKFALCIDEDFDGFNQDGLGERLFDANGEQTQYLKNVMEFLKKEQTEFQRTRLFCDKIKELDLLEPMAAQFTSKEGQKIRLGGFQAISRKKLVEVPGDKLSELAKSGILELIYLHLNSLNHVRTLAGRVNIPASEAQEGVPVSSDN